MSRSNRSKRFAAYLICLLGLLAIGYSIACGLIEERRYVQQANQAAAEYARYAAYQEKTACRDVAASELARCKADAKAEYGQKRNDNRRDYDDLIAQQRSALWTSIMGVAALIGIILSVAGVWLIMATFSATKEANEIAKRAADESALHAQQSLRLVIEGQRAVVSIKTCRQVEAGGSTRMSAVQFVVENDGNSTAHSFQAQMGFADQAVYGPRPIVTTNMDGICAAQKTATLAKVRFRSPKFYPVFLIGSLSYSSLGQVNFKSYFCFRLDGPLGDNPFGEPENSWLESVSCEGLLPNT